MSLARPRMILMRLLTLWLVAISVPAWALLTDVTETIPVASYGPGLTDVQMPITIATNHVTGEFVVCWALRSLTPIKTLQCTRFDATNTVLSTSETTIVTPTLVPFVNIEAAINDQGQVFVLWDDPDAPSFLTAFDSDGSLLFGPMIQPGIWSDVSLALTPDFVWVAGWVRVTPPGFDEQLYLFMLRYDHAGNLLGDEIHIQRNWDGSGGECRTSDLVSTTSGDLLLAWVIPTSPPGCFGTVRVSTFAQDGTPIAADIQLSDTVTDDDGNDISANFDPRAVAHDNGEYAVAWLSLTPEIKIQAATLTYGGTVAVPPDDLIPALPAAPFRVAGFPHNLDYFAIVGLGYPATECVLSARMVFEGDTTPDASFQAGNCSMGFDNAFNLAGDMMIARYSNVMAGQPGQVEVLILPRPAEIEISPVSVSEGDPQRGIGNFATLTALLSRPHPLGEDISVNYFTRDNTAFAGSDYQQTSDTLTFDGMSGETSGLIQIPIIPDTEYEADELFSVNLTSAVNAVIKNGDESAKVTILNDDVSPEILADCDAGNPTPCRAVQEMGPGQFTETLVTLTMAEPVGLPVNLSFATQPGGPDPARYATPGSDYVEVSGTLQIPAGTTQASFNLTVVGDDIPEDTETFQVVLSAGTAISLPQPTLTFSILDDNLCFLELDTTTLTFETAGGMQNIELTTLDDTCQWASTPDDPWVTLDPANGSDSQTIQVTADPWDPMGVVTRSTNVTIELTGGNGSGSIILEVHQNSDCSFTADPTSASFSPAGGAGSITVTPSDPACDWFVFTDEPWITITSPASTVTGNGTVEYSVSSNGSLNVENGPRQTTLNSDEFSFDVTQDGCVYDVDPAMVAVDAAGNDSVNVNVLAGPTVCQWSAVSNSTWIIIASGASGSGDGSVVLDVIENPSVVPRTGSITIADEMVTFEQAGQPCDFAISPDLINFCPDGDVFSVDISARAGCEWSLMETEDWLTVMTNASGSGEETATGFVDANLSESSRATTLSLVSTDSGLAVDDVQIQQQGFLEYEPFDGPLPADWLFDPMGVFSVDSSDLVVSLSGGGSGLAIHQNPMGTCSDCKVETSMEVTSVTSQSQEVSTLVGWYMSDDDYIGFGMDEFANQWNLYQVRGGVVVESNSVMVAQILPNQSYSVGIRYDGTTFRGFVDGVEMVALDKQPESTPFGYAGFMVNDSNARFTDLRVTGVFQQDQVLLKNSFEAPLLDVLSICTQE